MPRFLRRVQTLSLIAVGYAHGSGFIFGPVFGICALLGPESVKENILLPLAMCWAWFAAVGILGGLAVFALATLLEALVEKRAKATARLT